MSECCNKLSKNDTKSSPVQCTSDDFQSQKDLDLRQSPKTHLFGFPSELLHFKQNFEELRLTKCALIEETTFKSKDDACNLFV